MREGACLRSLAPPVASDLTIALLFAIAVVNWLTKLRCV